LKIRRIIVNQRKAQLEVVVASGTVFPLPFSQLSPRPTSANRIRDAYPDKELAKEALTYVLESGAEGSVHIDAVLEYNQDPHTMSELLLHQLTVQARNRIEQSGLSRRETARRLGTSLPQLYRLLDSTNTTKSLNQMISLLHVLGCEVSVVVKRRKAAA
jgi:DNA-binding TFAR19-related protein (PDSD5 family)